MTITTIYKCDKCGAEQPTSEQFWEVGITAKHKGIRGVDTNPIKTMEVCRPCLESFGIHAQKKPNTSEPPAPTIEDMIREIVQNAMGEM